MRNLTDGKAQTVLDTEETFFTLWANDNKWLEIKTIPAETDTLGHWHSRKGGLSMGVNPFIH